jgi:hypothetical protein
MLPTPDSHAPISSNIFAAQSVSTVEHDQFAWTNPGEGEYEHAQVDNRRLDALRSDGGRVCSRVAKEAGWHGT